MKIFIKIAVTFVIGIALFATVVGFAGAESLFRAGSLLFSYYGLFLLFLATGACFASIYRWRTIIKTQKGEPVSLKDISMIWFTGHAVDNATPVEFLGGGPVRTFLARKKLGITLGKSIASVVIDKVIDATFFTSFLIGGVFIFFILGKELSMAYVITGILIISIILFLLLYFYLRVLGKNSVFLWIFRKFTGNSYENSEREKLIKEVEDNIKVFFSKRKELGKALFFSLVKEFFRWSKIFFLIFFLIGSFEFEESLAVYGLANFSLILPIPAGIGTLEAVSGYAFHSFGWGFDTGTALAITWHGLVLFLVLIGSFFGMKFAVDLVPEKVEEIFKRRKKKT